MGIASLVLWIIGILTSWIPFIGLVSFILVVIGLVLGIIDLHNKTKANEKRGVSIAGVVVNAVGIPITIITTAIITFVMLLVIADDEGLKEITEDTIRDIYNERVWRDEIYDIYDDYDYIGEHYNI